MNAEEERIIGAALDRLEASLAAAKRRCDLWQIAFWAALVAAVAGWLR